MIQKTGNNTILAEKLLQNSMLNKKLKLLPLLNHLKQFKIQTKKWHQQQDTGSSNKRRKEVINFIKKIRRGSSKTKDYDDVDISIKNALNAGKKLLNYDSTNDEFAGQVR